MKLRNVSLKQLLVMTEQELFDYLYAKLPRAVTNKTHDYLFVQGGDPDTPSICLVAHLDTVFKRPPTRNSMVQTPHGLLYSKSLFEGLGADDRCGVYIILKAYYSLPESIRDRISLLFTRGEEKGGLGAQAFSYDYRLHNVTTPQFRYFIEVDRQGVDELVFYDTLNQEFIDYITTRSVFWLEHFHKHEGFRSDISILSPDFEVASVNISAGYFLEHTAREYVDLHALNSITSTLIRHLEKEQEQEQETTVWSF